MTLQTLNPQDAHAEWLRDTLWYPLSRWYLRPAAKAVARRLALTHVHPNAVTLSGLLLAAGAAVALLAGQTPAPHWRLLVAHVLPVVLLLAYWVADQVDGHLARITGRCSDYGSWLDANLDELVDVGLHVAIGWMLFERLASPVPLALVLAFVAGKYLFMFGLNGIEQNDPESVTDSTSEQSLIRRLYHLPADADVRLHVLLAAILLDPLVGALWWELAGVAVYYNFRWLARHILVRRRTRNASVGNGLRAVPGNATDSLTAESRNAPWGAAYCATSVASGLGRQVVGPLRVRAMSASGLPLLPELASLCQKPGHPLRGNWMARKVARPMALYLTRIVLPWGISANVVTAVAALTGLAAAAAFAYGPTYGLIAGAALLQLWYLLDHVDGQIARFRGTASVAGTYVDYLMHYVVHGACPFGLGWGLFAATGEAAWLLAGAAWSAGIVLLGLRHDCLYKAFFRRLRHTQGVHAVRGMADGGAQPAARVPSLREPARLASYAMQKACEMHVIMNAVSVFALVVLVRPATGMTLVMLTTAVMAGLAPLVALMRIVRAVSQGQPDREFTAWFPEIDPGETNHGKMQWIDRRIDRPLNEVTTATH
jgi:phosphatidylglycerophosphate synthase